MSYVFLLAALFATAVPVDAPEQRPARTATLAIQVADAAGAPLTGVLVTVEGPAERSLRTEGGRIVFEGIPAGAYRLRFEREGFITLERELTARAGAPMNVNVTLNPVPVDTRTPPEPEPEPELKTGSKTQSAPGINAQPIALDLPAVIEKEFIGRAGLKTTALSCASGGSATLIQLREPIVRHAHPDADEFLYVIAGEGTAALSGRLERLRAGVFMLVPRGMPHTITMTGRNPLMLLSTRAGEPCGGGR
jgi:mannose-6-phosphate isomerase-like protein (cupin superfamily)